MDKKLSATVSNYNTWGKYLFYVLLLIVLYLLYQLQWFTVKEFGQMGIVGGIGFVLREVRPRSLKDYLTNMIIFAVMMVMLMLVLHS